MTKNEILKALQDCDFDELAEENFIEKIIHNIHIPKLEYEQGATKGVLFFPDTDFVVKIPFEGSLIECGWNNDYTFSPFVHAVPNFFDIADFDDDTDGEFNYCEVEVELFDKAEKEGLDFLFAPTALLGFVNDYPIYQQPICQIYQKMDDIWHGLKVNANDYQYFYDTCRSTRCGCFNEDNEEWFLSVFMTYGEEVLTQLCIFLIENSINDLHCGNLGFSHGKPILVDYSSFYESY